VKFGTVTDASDKLPKFRLYSKKKEVLPKNTMGLIEVIPPQWRELQNTKVNVLAEADKALKQLCFVGCTVLTTENPMWCVPYVNLSDEDIFIRKGAPVSWGAILKEPQILCIHTNQAELDPAQFQPEDNKRLQQLIEDVIAQSECPEEHHSELRQILWKYKAVIAETSSQVGYCDLYEPGIVLDTETPIYTPQYKVPHNMRAAVKENIDQFFKMGIIQFSKSPYNSPTLIVKKKDGGTRLCVDFRKLNEHVVTDRHPLPRIDQILEELGGAQYFTALDLLHGFYNLKIRPEDRPKTAFSTIDGHFEFIRLPMGLKNSPSIFQRTMNMVLQELLGDYAFIYIDDIVIYSKKADDHLQHIANILERLEKHGLRVKFSKCQLFKHEIEYLGYLVGKNGMKVNPKKIKAIQDFPTPKDIKGIQAFLGVVGYFRQFIPDYATMARPLYKLLKKEVPFKWGEEQSEALRAFKKALTTAPVLAFPDFRKEFILTTDASGYAIGAILTQEDDKAQERLISCHSRTLKDAETRYNTFDKEILAVHYGVEQNRSYLWGSRFTIRTDNIAIPYLERSKTSDSSRAIRWFLKLGEYDYKVVHRKGKIITHADAISRYPCDSEARIVPNYVQPRKDQPKRVLNAYLSPQFLADTYVPELPAEEWLKAIKQTASNKLPTGDKVLQEDGFIYINDGSKKRIWVPPSLRKRMMILYHDSPISGHKGVKRTYASMKPDLIWTDMEKDVAKYIAKCKTCQQYKNYSNRKVPYKTTPIPSRCFDEISLDVVGPLPVASSGMKYILVVQDRLSRWISFMPMNNTGAETTSRVFLKEWVCTYGPPRKILTDRGRNFVSAYFQGLAKLLGAKPVNTVAYRPQANGMNERTHRDLHFFLSQIMEGMERMNWDTHLKLAAWVHNSAVHTALKISPYEMVTGMIPNPHRMWMPEKGEEISEEKLHEYFGIKKSKIEKIRQTAIEAIEKGQAGFLRTQESRRKPREFSIGQKVWVKNHTASKWAPKFFGPYLVHKVISESVLWLKDPGTGQLDTVHADYVKPFSVDQEGEKRKLPFPAEPAEKDDTMNHQKNSKNRSDGMSIDYSSRPMQPQQRLVDNKITSKPLHESSIPKKRMDDSSKHKSNSDESDDDSTSSTSKSEDDDDDDSGSSTSKSEDDDDDDPEDEYSDEDDADDQRATSSQSGRSSNIMEREPEPSNSSAPSTSWSGRVAKGVKNFFGLSNVGPQPLQTSENLMESSAERESENRFEIDNDFHSPNSEEVERANPSGFRESEDLISSTSASTDKKSRKRQNADLEIVQQSLNPQFALPRLRSRQGRKDSK
jgi:hypothetical protein